MTRRSGRWTATNLRTLKVRSRTRSCILEIKRVGLIKDPSGTREGPKIYGTEPSILLSAVGLLGEDKRSLCPPQRDENRRKGMDLVVLYNKGHLAR